MMALLTDYKKAASRFHAKAASTASSPQLSSHHMTSTSRPVSAGTDPSTGPAVPGPRTPQYVNASSTSDTQ